MSLVSDAIWAASPTTARMQPTVLSSDPKGERIAYASHKSIFLRNIDNPAISRQYTQHTAQTTVARFSPSGFYVASGDVAGHVRVWDCVGEGITKGEYHIIAGRINDIGWDGDSQRIIAVGDGKERFGHCITWDSGNTVGEISGHSKQINTVSIRQQRPLRAVTGGDDTGVVFYHGAPFKFHTGLRDQHSNYIYGSAYSPDGTLFASVGADRKIWLYDGRTAEPKGQIGEGVHSGSIFSISWSKDSKKFATSSADQTVRIWDAEAGKNTQTWRLGEEGVVNRQKHQVGVVWPPARSDGLIISVDMDGDLNYFNEGTPQPSRVVHGHQKNITASAISGRTFVTGSYEGRVLAWDTSSGLAAHIDGAAHTGYISGLAAVSPSSSSDPQIQSVAWDDTLRTVSLSSRTFAGSHLATSGQPKDVAVAGRTTLVPTPDSIQIFENGKLAGSTPLSFEPSTIAASASTVAVASESTVHIYTLAGSTLVPTAAQLRHPSTTVTALAFSPAGTRLAVGTSTGKIFAYESKGEGWALLTDRWSGHAGRVACAAWDASGEYAVSGGLDTHVFLWSVGSPGRRVQAGNAHKDGVTGVAWLEGEGGGKVLSAGSDGAVRVWKVTL